MANERFQFPGAEGQQLAAALEVPDQAPVAYALFAHCFTCGKDVLAAKRIAVALAAKGREMVATITLALISGVLTGVANSGVGGLGSTFVSGVAAVAICWSNRNRYWRSNRPNASISCATFRVIILACGTTLYSYWYSR